MTDFLSILCCFHKSHVKIFLKTYQQPPLKWYNITFNAKYLQSTAMLPFTYVFIQKVQILYRKNRISNIQ